MSRYNASGPRTRTRMENADETAENKSTLELDDAEQSALKINRPHQVNLLLGLHFNFTMVLFCKRIKSSYAVSYVSHSNPKGAVRYDEAENRTNILQLTSNTRQMV